VCVCSEQVSIENRLRGQKREREVQDLSSLGRKGEPLSGLQL
jgi:hypothetical protein